MGQTKEDMEPPDANPVKSDQKLRWYQYRLRTLFLLMLLVSIGMSWVAVKIQRLKGQRNAAKAIETAGGWVSWADEPGWLGTLLRDDSLRDVIEVSFFDCWPTDAEMVHLEALSELHVLRISSPEITDAGLVHLRGLKQLQELDLTGTNITDAGLMNLQDLNQLRKLSLAFTSITDVGLTHLRGLHKLQDLDLNITNASDEGVKKLRQAFPRCRIAADRLVPKGTGVY